MRPPNWRPYIKGEPWFWYGDVVADPDGYFGLVLKCINIDDPEDVKLQGYRYYVDFGIKKPNIWSMRERDLRNVKYSGDIDSIKSGT